MILSYFKTLTQKYSDDKSGVSAVEFALILPVFALLFFGSVELSFLMTVDRKVTQTASALGDLTARGTVMTEAEVDDIFSASSAIFSPYNGATAEMRVTSITQDAGTVEVAWSRAKNMSAYSPGDTVTVPTGLLSDGQSIIFAEVSYDYDSTLGFFLQKSQTLSEEFYLRPRRVTSVEIN